MCLVIIIIGVCILFSPFYGLLFIFAILATLLYIFSNPPSLPEGHTLALSKANITFTFIIVGFFSVSYTESVINFTDITNLPSILAHISDHLFSNHIQELPNMPNKCVNILDINHLKPKHHNDCFFSKDLATIVGQRPFLYIHDYTFILKYKYLILPFAATISYNILCKFDLMELCKQVGDFLALILRLFKTPITPILPRYTNYRVYPIFNPNYTYPDALINARINDLYNNISSLYYDTRVRISQIHDYLRENNLTLYHRNSHITIESTEYMNQSAYNTHVQHLRVQNALITRDNSTRRNLIAELRTMEIRVASENTQDVFQRSDNLQLQFDSIINEYNS
jgi:hypothetical protein